MAETLAARRENGESLANAPEALDALRASQAWSAEDERSCSALPFASLHDPALCAWAWKTWGPGERRADSGLFSMLAANLDPSVSEGTRVACAKALFDAGASPLDEQGDGPSAVDVWPELARVFAVDERASLREALASAQSQSPRKSTSAPISARKSGRRL